MRWRTALPAALLAPALLVGCSDDGGGSPAAGSGAGPLVGDTRCDDPTGDVYLAADPAATPTGRAPGIDLVSAVAELGEDELVFRFETVAPVADALFPELIVFGGRAEDAARYEVRAVGSDDGWAVRRVTFVDDVPVDAGLQATVEAHGTVVEFAVAAGLLPPPGDVISFSFAATAVDDDEAVNDECFPFAGRTPVGG